MAATSPILLQVQGEYSAGGLGQASTDLKNIDNAAKEVSADSSLGGLTNKFKDIATNSEVARTGFRDLSEQMGFAGRAGGGLDIVMYELADTLGPAGLLLGGLATAYTLFEKFSGAETNATKATKDLNENRQKTIQGLDDLANILEAHKHDAGFLKIFGLNTETVEPAIEKAREGTLSLTSVTADSISKEYDTLLNKNAQLQTEISGLAIQKKIIDQSYADTKAAYEKGLGNDTTVGQQLVVLGSKSKDLGDQIKDLQDKADNNIKTFDKLNASFGINYSTAKDVFDVFSRITGEIEKQSAATQTEWLSSLETSNSALIQQLETYDKLTKLKDYGIALDGQEKQAMSDTGETYIKTGKLIHEYAADRDKSLSDTDLTLLGVRERIQAAYDFMLADQKQYEALSEADQQGDLGKKLIADMVAQQKLIDAEGQFYKNLTAESEKGAKAWQTTTQAIINRGFQDFQSSFEKYGEALQNGEKVTWSNLAKVTLAGMDKFFASSIQTLAAGYEKELAATAAFDIGIGNFGGAAVAIAEGAAIASIAGVAAGLFTGAANFNEAGATSSTSGNTAGATGISGPNQYHVNINIQGGIVDQGTAVNIANALNTMVQNNGGVLLSSATYNGSNPYPTP